MAAAEEHQQHPQEVSHEVENEAHMSNQVSPKSAQKQLCKDVEKVESELDMGENKENAATKAATEIGNAAKDTLEKHLRNEGSVGVNVADLVAGDSKKDTGGPTTLPLAENDDPLPIDVDNDKEKKRVETSEAVDAEKQQVDSGGDAKLKEPVAMEMDANKDTGTGVSAVEVMSLQVEEVRSPIVANAMIEKTVSVDMEVDSDEEASSAGQVVMSEGEKTNEVLTVVKTIAVAQSEEVIKSAVGDTSEDVDMAVDDISHTGEDHKEVTAIASTDVEVSKTVGEIVTTLVENMVDFMDETVSVEMEESVKILSSPLMPHLSADEAMELLEVHQGDDHELLPEHDAGADVDVETEPADNREYQWFDGDEEDDETAAIETPSVLDVAAETTDDVFGFSGVDLADVTTSLGENNADVNSDGSGDTLVIPSNSSSSSSSSSSNSASSKSSSSGSSSSSSSSSGASSASEDEKMVLASKKRHAPGSSGPRKLLKYKKQKRVRSSEPEKPQRRRYKRKRKIPQPVIPPEFAVFETEAADPILKGSYAVRNNRRACFVGTWGFSDEAFQNFDSVSPFEYTSRTRVLMSRRKDDKRPISGKYGGFFKLRQFNGKLVKIREDQVDLQFLPMPSSDGEDEDEDMEGYESDDDNGEEPIASRYAVLGKGKNRFGRFLIRGYLNPESGRLTVKRRYLE